MTTEIAALEETGARRATVAGEQPKPTKKARVARQGAHVAPGQGPVGQEGRRGEEDAQGPQERRPARDGSKTAKILDLLKRADGATLKELMKATGWQPHSVRGFVSGTVGKKMGLIVTSTKGEGGERSYSIKS